MVYAGGRSLAAEVPVTTDALAGGAVLEIYKAVTGISDGTGPIGIKDSTHATYLPLASFA
jgi:hypothetical protein